jgi:hypothetical protein
MKFETTIVTGDCPECQEKTILVNIYKNYFRCVNCGEDTEQKINGVIKYMKVDKDTELRSRELEGLDG